MTAVLAIRRATLEDARFVWDVNNDPSVRAQSISTGAIPWPTHEAWYERKLADERTLMFIASDEHERFGVVRFDVEGNEVAISIAMSAAHRGKGLGGRLIEVATEQVLRLLPNACVVAWVRPDNTASLRAFARAGYVRVVSDVRDGVALERLEHRSHGAENCDGTAKPNTL